MKRVLKILRIFFFILVGVITLCAALLYVKPVQDELARKAAKMLSERLKTKVSVGSLQVEWFNKISLKTVYIEDQYTDTLMYAGELNIRITDWIIVQNKPTLHYLELKNTIVHLYRTRNNAIWNYSFIESAFASKEKSKGKSSGFEFDLKTVALENVRLHMDDSWVGWDMNYDIGRLNVDVRTLDFKKKLIDVNDIIADEARVFLKQYIGGRPDYLIKTDSSNDNRDYPFNPGNWRLKVRKTNITDSRFALILDTITPVPGVFDYRNIDVTNINMKIGETNIVGDTIRGAMLNLSAKEQCGIVIKSMRSNITVSPNASICDNLLIETAYSKVKNYYAMHYRHFPDFLQYMDSVTMTGELKDATIDLRDIAYFAPALKTLPPITVHGGGSGRGVVSDMRLTKLDFKDGLSQMQGNMTITGLPDISKCVINFTDGALRTSGEGILKYFPTLKGNENFAFDKIAYADFKGSYNGRFENFTVNGILASNLGDIVADMHLEMPNFNPDSSIYGGSVMTNNLQIGTFLNRPEFGIISLKQDITGYSFNPNIAAVNMDGDVSGLTVNGYSYRNINTRGILAKQQFIGYLHVDDTNLSLDFDGGIDFRDKELNVKAKAHLVNCNFKALNLTADNFAGSADFDLNCVGSDIDNFRGYARLENINIHRNEHKLALDSVFIKASGDSQNKSLVILSNAGSIRIKGDYKLTNLPASVQYYLSGYLPDYIKKPSNVKLDQNLEFTINTNLIDSIFAMTIPWLRGFDTSYISGIFDTRSQNLSLVANIPNCTIGPIKMNNVALSCRGDQNQFSFKGTVDDLSYRDSVLAGGVDMAATVSNDSLVYTLLAQTHDSVNSVALNGCAVSRHDTLYAALQPSSFYINKIKWDIGGGCNIVYHEKYLNIGNLNMASGLQKIYVSTSMLENDPVISIGTENLDIAQLGSNIGLSPYQPDGRISASFKIRNILNDFQITGALKATNVKFGTDTLGTIDLIGGYDKKTNILSVDPESGIQFENHVSAGISGNFLLDQQASQAVNASIRFENAPLSASSPFVMGVFSRMSGTINGAINLSGKLTSPDMDGKLTLKNASFKLDFMGTSYKIPEGNVYFKGDKLVLGTVIVEDVYKNKAYATGYIDRLVQENPRMHFNIRADKFEAMRLTHNDNIYFYGNAIVGADSFVVDGPFNDITLSSYNMYPAAKSHLVIPVPSTGDIGAYSYISFKSYGKSQEKPVRKSPVKFSIDLDANLNPLAEITILLDPSSGDAIDASGSGNIQLKMPANNDMNISGTYNIDYGIYTFSFKELPIYTKQFTLSPGSSIYFKGPFSSTTLDVLANYTARARLYDLLNSTEQTSITSPTDKIDAQRIQSVNILLHMQDIIFNPKLTFDLSIEDKSMENNLAYNKLKLINQDERQKVEQVASLLLTGSFMSQDGLFGKNSGSTIGLNSFSQMLSGTLSSGLTSIVNKLTGETNLNINVNYQNYNYADATAGISSMNRNQVSGTLSYNLLNDRLIVEGGAKSDWAANTTGSAAVSPNFRAQYLLTPSGKLRLNCFSTGDYDVTLERNITRNGVGISWRKSFSDLRDFVTSDKKKNISAMASKKSQNVLPDTIAQTGEK